MEILKKNFWLLLDIFIAAAIIALIFVFVPAVQKSTETITPSKTITVSAEGKATATPDIAITSFSVITKGKDVKSVVAENNSKANSVIAAVKAIGIDEKDIKTTEYNLYPENRWDDILKRQVSDGYIMTQTLTIKIRNMEKIVDVLNAGPDRGANQIGGITFSVDNPDKYIADARTEAVQKAKDKAAVIASTAGVKLGEIIGVSESSSGYPQPATYDKFGLGGGAPSMASAPTIQAGSQEVTLNVSLTYVLK